jgi:hypothetical protein
MEISLSGILDSQKIMEANQLKREERVQETLAIIVQALARIPGAPNPTTSPMVDGSNAVDQAG